MSKLLNNYINLKKQNPNYIYLFKNGIFYLALEDDARFLSKEFNLKLTSLNAEAVKCGFPCSSFDKYYLMLTNINKEFKIIDKETISSSTVYLENKEILELLKKIKDVDINSLSVSEAFSFIENINENSKKILENYNEL